MVSEAEDIVDTMRKEGIEPNVVTYSILVDANCKKGMVSIAEDIVETMRKEGIEPNVVTYNTLMKGMCQSGRISVACELWRNMLLWTRSKSSDLFHSAGWLLRKW
ncbi:hypothetical protein F3Y22_tig00110482pilonHSYRG00836 [Hibiscus syriacus]|uniref:Pentatricopeptide repeat-containing protein n=1 Tax=Hibiscus syriacus TaxID=106335 RepID=A0A6A3AIQ1_HIBSY|nr:hypothetical protein F3Y22_tig00110482pilonHSYRG00836 [Hibiscus syriacus]